MAGRAGRHHGPGVVRIVDVGRNRDCRSRSASPGVVLLTPPASVTSPAVSPVMVAASFCAWIVTVTSCAVPSAVSAVKVSVSVSAPLSACTAAWCCRACRSTRPPPSARRCRSRCRRGAGRDRLPGIVGVVGIGGVEVAAVADAGLPVPASTTAGIAPVMVAASFCASMVTVTSCAVPSAVSTLNVSVSVAAPLSACTAGLVLSSV